MLLTQHRTVQSHPDHLSDAARIVAVGLVDLRLQHRLHVPRLDTDHWQACFRYYRGYGYRGGYRGYGYRGYGVGAAAVGAAAVGAAAAGAYYRGGCGYDAYGNWVCPGGYYPY
jgi:hypothetical protein